MKVADFLEEIKELQNKGYSSIRVKSWLEDKKGLSVGSRTIRDVMQKNGSPFNSYSNSTNTQIKKQIAEEFNLPEDLNAKVVWLKSKHMSAMIKVGNDILSFDDMKSEFLDKMLTHSPSFRKIKRKKIKDPPCLVIDPADIHVGKYASEEETDYKYNQELAIKRVLNGIQGILDKSAGFNFDKIVLVVGNDVLHTDNNKRTTTGGTPQDTDKNWYENYKGARDMYIEIIQILKRIADVHIIHCPSNHDFVTGWMLSDSLYCYFHKDKNVSFDVSTKHRKYYRYGNSLIGLSHGDGANMDMLPLLMAEESKEDWYKSKFRYIYLHHIHHFKKFKFKTGTDTPGCTVEFLRSPSGTDSWHNKMGYTHAPKAVEAFIHSKEHGQIAKITHLF